MSNMGDCDCKCNCDNDAKAEALTPVERAKEKLREANNNLLHARNGGANVSDFTTLLVRVHEAVEKLCAERVRKYFGVGNAAVKAHCDVRTCDYCQGVQEAARFLDPETSAL